MQFFFHKWGTIVAIALVEIISKVYVPTNFPRTTRRLSVGNHLRDMRLKSFLIFRVPRNVPTFEMFRL